MASALQDTSTQEYFGLSRFAFVELKRLRAAEQARIVQRLHISLWAAHGRELGLIPSCPATSDRTQVPVHYQNRRARVRSIEINDLAASIRDASVLLTRSVALSSILQSRGWKA